MTCILLKGSTISKNILNKTLKNLHEMKNKTKTNDEINKIEEKIAKEMIKDKTEKIEK